MWLHSSIGSSPQLLSGRPGFESDRKRNFFKGSFLRSLWLQMIITSLLVKSFCINFVLLPCFGYTLYCKQCRLKSHLYSALNWTNCEILPARNACWLSNHMNITCSSYRLKQGERLSPHHSNLFSVHYHSCYWSQFLSPAMICLSKWYIMILN